MARIELSPGRPITSRECVVCGSVERSELRQLTFGGTWTASGHDLDASTFPDPLPRMQVGVSYTVALPFTPECYAAWRRVGAFWVVSLVAAMVAPVGGLVASAITDDSTWTYKGFGTAVVLAAFPIFLGLMRASRGPRCVGVGRDRVVLEIPSEAAARAIRASGHGNPLDASDLAREVPTVRPGTPCAKHPERAARFACTKCRAAGCRDCEVGVGSPPVLVCTACFRSLVG